MKFLKNHKNIFLLYSFICHTIDKEHIIFLGGVCHEGAIIPFCGRLFYLHKRAKKKKKVLSMNGIKF
ncbi:hypothetical protein CHI10_01370 [Bacillus sp. 7894-2]|nr:hypothetical protein CHI10_01370 [Bacillus sp. 7894-2]